MKPSVSWEGNGDGDCGWVVVHSRILLTIRAERQPSEGEVEKLLPSAKRVRALLGRLGPRREEPVALVTTEHGAVLEERVVGRTPYEIVFSFSERHAADVPVEEIRVIIVPAASRSWAAAFAVPSLLVLVLLAWLAVQLPPSRFSDAIKLVLAPSFGGLLVAGVVSLRDPRRLPNLGIVHDSRIAGLAAPALGFTASQELEPRAQHLFAFRGRGEVRAIELDVYGPAGGPIVTSHHAGDAWLTTTVKTLGADAPLGKLECGLPGAVPASVKAWLLPVNGTRLRSLFVRQGDAIASRWTAGNEDRLSAWMCLPDSKPPTVQGGAPRPPHALPDRAELTLDEGWYPDFDWTVTFPAGRTPPVIDVMLDKERLGKVTCLDEREPKAPLRVGPVPITDGSHLSRASVRFEQSTGRPLVSTWKRAEGAVRYGDWVWMCRPNEHVHAAPVSIWRRGDADHPVNAEMRGIEIVPETDASPKARERGAREDPAKP